MLSPGDIALLFGVGIVGAFINAAAGGGTLLTFPTFLAVGVPPVLANTSNAVAIWPGRFFVIAHYRRELFRQRERAVWTVIACALGAVAGSLILLRSTDASFIRVVPWLILGGTVLFLFDAPLSRRLKSHLHEVRPSPGMKAAASVALFLLSVYGGYFGAGLGIMYMPVLALSGVKDMQELNGLKNLLASTATTVSVLTYLIAGAVYWPATLSMMGVGLIGGYLGGRIARRVSAVALRRVVIAAGFVISGYYFWKIYF